MIEKYLSQGFHCIPCLKASKKSALPAGYSTIEYGEKGIIEEQAEGWDDRFPIEKGYGRGLLCGTASRTIALDIDSDDAELGKLLPESPCVKVGKTGETRFFRYNPAFPRTLTIGPKIPLPKGVKDQVEILSNGKYTLLPPSIHEETKVPYIWISEDQLSSLTPDDLPELDPSIVEIISDYYAKKYGYDKGERKSVDLSGHYPAEDGRVAHGAYLRLKKFVAILAEKETPIEIGVQQLIDYDKEHHGGKCYFEDKTRGVDSSADMKANALRFYANIIHTISRERIKRGDAPLKFLYELNEPMPVRQIIVETKRELPKARGEMRNFQKYCELISNGKQDALSLGGAVTLMSILCANRYRTQTLQFDVRSNLYVINLAKSGAGKNFAQCLISDLLEDTKLMGSNSYKSGSSIIQGLPDQQERLNIMDECAAFLKSIAEGEGFQQEINDVLSGLFTCSNRKFNGISTVKDGDRFGACYNPSVSILGSTTMYGFKNSVNKSMGDKGLMPRFLTFWQYDVGDFKVPSKSDIAQAHDIFKSLKQFVDKILKEEKRVASGFEPPIVKDGEVPEERKMGTKYDPILIPMDDEASALYVACLRKNFPANNQTESFEDAFKNRFAEIAAKCALFDAVSLGLDQIHKDSMQWGIDVVEATWANIRGIYEQTSAENLTERNAIAVFEFIKSKQDGITASELARKFQKLGAKGRKDVVDNLLEANRIVVQNKVNPGAKKETTTYFLA